MSYEYKLIIIVSNLKTSDGVNVLFKNNFVKTYKRIDVYRENQLYIFSTNLAVLLEYNLYHIEDSKLDLRTDLFSEAISLNSSGIIFAAVVAITEFREWFAYFIGWCSLACGFML
jgi:hypothetical protein